MSLPFTFARATWLSFRAKPERERELVHILRRCAADASFHAIERPRRHRRGPDLPTLPVRSGVLAWRTSAPQRAPERDHIDTTGSGGWDERLAASLDGRDGGLGRGPRHEVPELATGGRGAVALGCAPAGCEGPAEPRVPAGDGHRRFRWVGEVGGPTSRPAALPARSGAV